MHYVLYRHTNVNYGEEQVIKNIKSFTESFFFKLSRISKTSSKIKDSSKNLFKLLRISKKNKN